MDILRYHKHLYYLKKKGVDISKAQIDYDRSITYKEYLEQTQ